MTINKGTWLEQQILPEIESKSNRHRILTYEQSSFIQQGTVETSCDEQQTVMANLTPLDDRGRLSNSTKVEVSNFDGRDISFHHPLPLASRRAFVSIEDEQFGDWEALVELGWCRFNRMGHYTSGGRIVRPTARTA